MSRNTERINRQTVTTHGKKDGWVDSSIALVGKLAVITPYPMVRANRKIADIEFRLRINNQNSKNLCAHYSEESEQEYLHYTSKICFFLAPGLIISSREQGKEKLPKMRLFFCFLLIHASFFHNADDICI